MIPADADRQYLETHHALKIEDVGRTLRTVDGKPQWTAVRRITARCGDRKLTANLEILFDKMTPELLVKETDRLLNELKVEILKREEAEHGC